MLNSRVASSGQARTRRGRPRECVTQVDKERVPAANPFILPLSLLWRTRKPAYSSDTGGGGEEPEAAKDADLAQNALGLLRAAEYIWDALQGHLCWTPVQAVMHLQSIESTDSGQTMFCMLICIYSVANKEAL